MTGSRIDDKAFEAWFSATFKKDFVFIDGARSWAKAGWEAAKLSNKDRIRTLGQNKDTWRPDEAAFETTAIVEDAFRRYHKLGTSALGEEYTNLLHEIVRELTPYLRQPVTLTAEEKREAVEIMAAKMSAIKGCKPLGDADYAFVALTALLEKYDLRIRT
jgi:hypothetical protein